MTEKTISSYLLNDVKKFNEIFRKDFSYYNIKSHKKPGLYPTHCLELLMVHTFCLTIFTSKIFLSKISRSALLLLMFEIGSAVVNHTVLATVAMFVYLFLKCSFCFSKVIVVTSWATKMIHKKNASFVMQPFVFVKS